MTKLTPAQSQKLQAEADRRAAFIERQTAEYQADIARVQALYAQGSTRRLQDPVVAQFQEATRFHVTRIPGGVKQSKAAEKAAATRRGRPLDMSPEAVAKREKRRARRAARKARQAAMVG